MHTHRANGAEEVKQHPYFKSMDWEKMAKKELPPPFKPANTVYADSIGNVVRVCVCACDEEGRSSPTATCYYSLRRTTTFNTQIHKHTHPHTRTHTRARTIRHKHSTRTHTHTRAHQCTDTNTAHTRTQHPHTHTHTHTHAHAHARTHAHDTHTHLDVRFPFAGYNGLQQV